jgi:citrate lyase subunit beta/citryl-CoA lyase
MSVPRSYLFVPGDSERKLARAADSGADALILDLEDGVSSVGKVEARTRVAAHLAQPAESQVWVRVNGLDSGLLRDDLAAVIAARPTGVVLPKCEGARDIRRLAAELDRAEASAGTPAGSTRILGIVTETATGALALAVDPPSHPRLAGLMWGAEDLAADLGADANRDDEGAYTEPFRFARTLCLYAAAAAKISAIDAVCTSFKDLEALGKEAREARRDGFHAKAAIHPDQVAPIHAAFAPSAADRLWAERVAALLEGEQLGAVSLDGEMIDRPHLQRARRILAAGN